MAVRCTERCNGYWVSTADRQVRSFSWEDTLIADNHRQMFAAQALGIGRGRLEARLSFEGLVDQARGEGVWIYDPRRWLWRITFRGADEKPYVFITFKEPRGPLPYDSYRTSVFGAIYDETSIVGYVRWRVSFKEAARLYQDMQPTGNRLLDRLYRMALVYPTMFGAAGLSSVASWAWESLRAAAAYGYTLYMSELISPDVAPSDALMPYPHQLGISSDPDLELMQGWKNPV